MQSGSNSVAILKIQSVYDDGFALFRQEEDGTLGYTIIMKVRDGMGISDSIHIGQISNSRDNSCYEDELRNIFDDYKNSLIQKYQFNDDASLKNYYEKLPEGTLVEIIQKNCFRIMKIIRNAIEHHKNDINVTDSNYRIDYVKKNSNKKGTHFYLDIDINGLEAIYNVMYYLINMHSLSNGYFTEGHYEGILSLFYSEVYKGIVHIEDDIGNDDLIKVQNAELKYKRRILVKTPYITSEDDDTVTFYWYPNNGSETPDYLYKDSYLLPEELGVVNHTNWFPNKYWEEGNTITFDKRKLLTSDRWKIQAR